MSFQAPSRLGAVVAIALLAAACGGGGSNTPTTPYTPPTTVTPTSPATNGNLALVVGNNFFTPTTDTVAVGSTVVWTWTDTGTVPHSVQSTGSPSFASSAVLTGDGSTYGVNFAVAGTYTYNCAIHGNAMQGRIVVR